MKNLKHILFFSIIGTYPLFLIISLLLAFILQFIGVKTSQEYLPAQIYFPTLFSSLFLSFYITYFFFFPKSRN